MSFLVSPTEPPSLRAIGKSTMFPEKFGVDVCWRGMGGWCGVQRKELSDLLHSVRDGRLGLQLRQMAGLKLAVVMVEGRLRYTEDGELIHKSFGRDRAKPWTRKQINGVLWSIQSKGVYVHFTESLPETIDTVQMFAAWSRKDSHSGLESRPGPDKDAWGNNSVADWQKHVLMGLPGVGAGTAQGLLDHCGFPLMLRPDVKLSDVKGIGKERERKIMEVINGHDHDQA